MNEVPHLFLRADQEDIPCVHPKAGKTHIQSLLDAPFGTAFHIDQVMPDWTWLSIDDIKILTPSQWLRIALARWHP